MRKPLKSNEVPVANEPGYIRPKNLPDYVPFTTNTAYRLARQGRFPRPIKFAPGISAWKRADVQAWLADKEAA